MLEDLVNLNRRTLGHWSVTTADNERIIYHYTTPMLRFTVDDEGNPLTNVEGCRVSFSTGHGSVSDQQGMNRLFRKLGLPFYFSRKGGADISLLDTDQPWSCWHAEVGTVARRLANVNLDHVLRHWPILTVSGSD